MKEYVFLNTKEFGKELHGATKELGSNVQDEDMVYPHKGVAWF